MIRPSKLQVDDRKGWVSALVWRRLRICTQAIVLVAVLLGPLLGGLQRSEESMFSAWQGSGSDLPQWLGSWLSSSARASASQIPNPLKGGGIAGEYFSIALMDPLAGSLALLHSDGSLRSLLALMLPLILALVAGRFFCGWLCPFGVIAPFW